MNPSLSYWANRFSRSQKGLRRDQGLTDVCEPEQYPSRKSLSSQLPGSTRGRIDTLSQGSVNEIPQSPVSVSHCGVQPVGGHSLRHFLFGNNSPRIYYIQILSFSPPHLRRVLCGSARDPALSGSCLPLVRQSRLNAVTFSAPDHQNGEKKIEVTNKILKIISLPFLINMPEIFCRRTARKARMWGYSPEQAKFLSRFCYLTMVSVGCALFFSFCGRRTALEKESEDSFEGAIGATLDPSLKSLAGDGDGKPRALPARARSDVFDCPDRWHGPGSDVSRAPLRRFPDIQRRLPAH